MNIRTRILLLIGVLIGAYIGSLGLVRYWQNANTGHFLSNREEEIRQLFDKIVELKGKSLNVLVDDYTFWDEMVAFVESGDAVWASENIDTGLSTFDADYAWIFKPDLSLAYATQISTNSTLVDFPLPPEKIRSLFASKPLTHFFISSAAGMLELRGGSIHPTADEARKTPAQGYFFVARRWDDALLAEFSSLFGGTAKIDPLEAVMAHVPPMSRNGDMLLHHVLPGPEGESVGVLLVHIHSPIFAKFVGAADWQFMIGTGFALFLVLLLSISLFFWVALPLGRISESLNRESLSPLQGLQMKKTEFGHIARLIARFFHQKDSLTREIEQRRQAEQELQYRLSLEELITTFSSRFITLPPAEIDAEIGRALGRIGVFADIDRTFVYLFSPHYDQVSCTHEWCAEGIESALDRLKNIPVSEYPWLMGKHRRGETVLIPSVSQMPPEASAERAVFEKRGIRSLYAVPMVCGNRVMGFLGFELLRGERTWREDLFVWWKLVGEVFVNALQRKHAEDERTRLENQLLQAQKIESIGRLAGGVAHDFNNLLTPILGYTEFAIEKTTPDSPLRKDLEQINRAAEQAKGLTQQLLAFGRKQTLALSPVDLNTVLAETEHLLRPLIMESIQIKTHHEPGLGIIKGDPAQLRQIIVNLAVNARDAMPKGGVLTIRTKNITLGTEDADAHPEVPPGPYAVLTVSDTGFGMNETVKRHLFEPFFTTKEQGKGTGLGLATIYGTVTQHGGIITVDSEPGKGTTFTIFLPRVDEAVDQPPPPPVGDRRETGEETILLVEDADLTRQFARQVLTERGYQVIPAATPDEALRRAERYPGPIHLLLTDVIMPQMNGKELYDQLVEKRPGLKVLYISGYPRDVIAHHGVLDAGVHFLPKPVSILSLAQKVRSLLDS